MTTLTYLLRWTVLATLLASPAGFGAPKLSISEYAEDRYAAFTVSDSMIRYVMIYKVSDSLARPLFAEIEFQNPLSRKEPLIASVELPSGDELKAKSGLFPAIKNNKKYKVQLRLYRDADHTDLIGVHKSKVRFSVPSRTAADQLGIKLL